VADPLAKLLGGGDEAGGGGSSELDAAKDLISAVKAGDARAVSLALTRHYEACQAKESDVEPDEDDGYEEG
jgi:DNA-binding GntR family transcriptional regulator